ncbi:hypothetical protein [Deinococcus hohokamensis]|uniref:Uncharacterized protein n=1 Tax=Deinococcus hohokamensis TaxID=309883 RepID=A0ABV9ID20_9DEIO
MRRLLLTGLVVLAAGGQAAAADYSKAVWAFVLGQAPTRPLMDSRLGDDMVLRLWQAPTSLPARGVFVVYMPGLSQAHWAVMLMDPQGRVGDFVGATRLTFVKTVPNPKKPAEKMNLSRLGDGMFKGLYVMEGTVADRAGKPHRLVTLLTPQMLDEELQPGEVLNR